MGRGFRSKLVAAGCSAALSLLSLPLRAADEPEHINEFEITPFVGYQGGGEFEDPLDGTDRELDEDTSFGFIANAAAEYWRHYELLYSQQSTTVQGETPIDMDVQYLQIGGSVSHPDMRARHPVFRHDVRRRAAEPGRAGAR